MTDIPLPPTGSTNWTGWAADEEATSDAFRDGVSVTELSATGTKDVTTFLRGDNTWAVPAGGGGGATSDLRAFRIYTPENYGAVGDGVVDDTTAINACLAAAGAANGVVWFEAGASYKASATLAQSVGLVQIEGNGATITFTGNSYDLLSLGPTGQSDVARTGGYVRRLALMPPGGDDVNTFAPENGKAGLVWNSTRHARTEDVYVGIMDIGFDLRGNCYGHKFIRPRNAYTCQVALLLRGGSGLIAGSGSDIHVEDAWVGGLKASFWCEGGAGGYWFTDCKPGAGHNTYVSGTQDHNGVWVMGLTYDAQTTVVGTVAVNASTITVADGSKVFGNEIVIDGQEIQVLSKAGNVLTVATSSTGGWQAAYNVKTAIASGAGVRVASGLGNVAITSGGVEGSTKVHGLRLFHDVSGLNISGFSFNANNDGAANDVRKLLSVLKHTGGGRMSATFTRCMVQGSWLGAAPLVLTNRWDNANQVHEEGTTHGTSAPTFAGVATNLIDRPMVSWSSISGATAIARDKMYLGGRGVRVNAGALEVSDTSLSTWSAVGGAASTNEFPGPVKVVNSAYTLAAGDAGGLVIYDVGGTAGTYTLPAGVSSGYTVSVSQGFSGQLTVTAAGSAGPDGIRTPTGIFTTVKTKTSGSVLKFVKDAGTRWYLLPYGDAYVAP